MKYTTLGKTQLQVSRIALGGYPFSGVNKANGWDPYSSEGRATAIRTIHTALDAGINYIDTAPSYGNGHSESIIGDVLKTRRDDCYLATKVGWKGLDKAAVIKSVEESLSRLQTDYVDVIQFHGGMYTAADTHHILNDGPLEALESLKSQGKVRWLGLTTEEPFSALDLVETGHFSVVQPCYNIIYQSAALHLLKKTAEKNIGVAVMRPMTSGIFQRTLEHLEPQVLAATDVYALCLKFLLSDSRVDVLNIGMRWPEEVEQNIRLLDAFNPSVDVSDIPRLTARIYQTDDERKGVK
ncbi:aldo/keto reductase [Paenibacillus sp. FSL H8-0034]|uniref:aldo/keto reductase n=1 Tax=Paenibacillus sp. FSL H8-0034 TaxID=2954671 RepID=UPI0030F4B521